MRGFAFGIVVLVSVSLAVLSIRPGGLRRQLRFAARRLRIVLVLAGFWTFGSLAIRVAFSSGPVLDYGPALLGVLLAIAFVLMARDPTTPID